MDALRHTNDILHGQVQSLGVQVNRLIGERESWREKESERRNVGAQRCSSARKREVGENRRKWV